MGGSKHKVTLSRGCPQGSILGPTLRNVTMEALLKTIFPGYIKIKAYADDIAITVAAETRNDLKERAAAALIPVLDWGRARGLTFSASKSEALITKGSLQPGFSIPFGNDTIVTKPTVKYLGIYFDQYSSFKPHINKVTTTSLDIFSKLRGSLGQGWGITLDNVLAIYRCVFLPKISYGMGFWAKAVSNPINKKKLNMAQRRALLSLACAYKTCSTEALQVLTGIFPLDIDITRLYEIKCAKTLPPGEATAAVHRANNKAIDIWQQRWSASTKGRWTYSFFPSIKTRLQQPIWLTHQTTQILSGHGNFNEKLASFRLVPSPACPCGEGNESAEHVIFACSRFTAQRQRLELACHRAGHLWPCPPKTLVSSKALFTALTTFSHNIFDTTLPLLSSFANCNNSLKGLQIGRYVLDVLRHRRGNPCTLERTYTVLAGRRKGTCTGPICWVTFVRRGRGRR